MRPCDMLSLDPADPETGHYRIIVETPRGSRSKLKLDTETGLFTLNKVLPAGAEFPHDFGFFPSTAGQDGDPLDVLLLSDDKLFPGLLVVARIIGAIEAEQTDKDGTLRNDRLLAVAVESLDYVDVKEIGDLGDSVVRQIEHFFISYNTYEGREFKPIGRAGAIKAKHIFEQHRKRYAAKHK
ncbi:MAG TPA: inorganic diphosphatase [Chthonomonadaceae bacterium]|nr:inorganic diphosphatase [Chthonomonadaceae bacterium]